MCVYILIVKVNYWRESAAGLQSIPYFFGKWIANIPRITCAAVFFWVAFSVKYQNTGNAGALYLIILALYWFGFAIGYAISQMVPINYTALTGVLVALIFSVALAGANPNMASVNEKPQGEQVLWKISGPRWALEAFYVDAIQYYEKVPHGSKYSDQPYQDVKSGLTAIGYDIHNYDEDIKGMIWDGIGWSMFALLLMLVTYRQKKL